MITGYRFLDAQLDLDQRHLEIRGRATALRPKPFHVMKLLVEGRGRVVSKDELLETVWADTFVQESSITRAVSELRQILGTGRGDERYIATVSGVGYRFVPHVEAIHSRIPATGRSRHPFVGRREEIETCARFFEEVRTGHTRILCLTGEPGIGKSSLMQALVETYQDPRSLICAAARCPQPVEADSVPSPVIDLVENLCAGEAGEDRKATLGRTAPTWYREAFAPTEPGDGTIAAGRRDHELRAFLEELAQSTPAVLFIDDFHWASRSTLGLLLYLASHFEALPVALVLLYRPTDMILAEHPWLAAKLEFEARGVCRELPLRLLDPSEIREYVDLTFPGNRFPEGLVASLVRRTEGHPLFLASLLDHLHATGLIDNSSGRWALTSESLDNLPGLPVTIESMISRQLSRLDPSERELLAIASLRGHEFEAEVAADALGQQREAVARDFERLETTHRLICQIDPQPPARPDTATWYRFSHALYQQALAAEVRGAQRRDLCGSLATCIGALYGADDPSMADRLAFLHEEAGHFDEAARLKHVMARRANEKGATADAIAHARRGIALLGTLPQNRDVTELEVLLYVTLADAQKQGGATREELDRTVERIRTLSRQIDQTRTGLWDLASRFASRMRTLNT